MERLDVRSATAMNDWPALESAQERVSPGFDHSRAPRSYEF
ncbi:hypothetical protein MBT84_47990 [Streptomyces sp. MBT84]|nr:hypothetical protein [Streptomyces sp. MBT84]